MIIGPCCPAPSFRAMKMYPGAVSCAWVVTSMVAGVRSGRERKACTYLGRADGERRVRWSVGRACEVVARVPLVALHPGMFSSANHALPAPITLRNSRREGPVLRFLLLRRLPRHLVNIEHPRSLFGKLE